MGRRALDQDATTEPSKKKNRFQDSPNDSSLSPSVERSLPPGEILTDVTRKRWRIGKAIGRGSFGEIYLASDEVAEEATAQNSRYAVKIEPHSNGPLFVEIHCLIRTGRHSEIKKWQEEKKLKLLGMPHYVASGSHSFDGTRYRFLVLPRYESDLEKILRSPESRPLRSRNALVLGAQIIDVLEYLHSKGYTHSDIKSSNLAVGFDGSALANRKRDDSGSCTSSKKNLKSRIRHADYYYDEDFVLRGRPSVESDSDVERISDSETTAVRVKRSKTKRPSPADSRNARMKGFFNLRKPKSDINYADFNSSICSYDSYQDLLEANRVSERPTRDRSPESDDPEADRFVEAVRTQSPGQVYLLDFGLASKFVNSDGTHKEFVMDQRKAHDGTLEYSSRDSHIGAHSRRSDLENLGYNMLDWLTGNLPWKTPEMLQDPSLVHAFKTNMMKDIGRLMETCFKSRSYPKFIEKYFRYLDTLAFDQKPDYRYCKSLFVDEFIAAGFDTAGDMVLRFKSPDRTPVRKRMNYLKRTSGSSSRNTPPDFLKRNAIVKVYGRENMQSNFWENSVKINLIKESLTDEGVRKPCASRNFFVSDADLITKLKQTLLLSHDTPSKKFSPKNLRSTKRIVKKKKGGRNGKSNIGKFGNFLGSDKQYTWAEILAGNPEDIIRNGVQNEKNPRSRKVSSASSDANCNGGAENDTFSNLLDRDYFSSLNPTCAMKEVVDNYKRRISGKLAPKNDECAPNEHGYTPAMIRVLKSMKKRQREVDDEEARSAPKKAASETVKRTKTVTGMKYKRGGDQITPARRGRRPKSKVDEEEETSTRSLRRRTGSNRAAAAPEEKPEKITKKNNKSATKTELNNKTPVVRSRGRKTAKASKTPLRNSPIDVPAERVIATRSRGLIKK